MADTALKNQPETMQSVSSIIDQVIGSAPAKTAPDRRQASGFIAVLADCEEHGKYPMNTLDDVGVERWFPVGCPTCRRQKNAAELLGKSNIPLRFLECSFENYTTTNDKQRHVLRRCMAYASDFEKHRSSGTCLLLCGRTGTGKNHLATAISRALLERGFTVLRIKASQYLDAYWAKAFDEREAWMRGMASVDLLVLDEIGRSSNAKAAQDAFFRLFDARYESQLPSLLATNCNREELIEVLGDATYDRLTQGGGVRLTLDWDSYRAKRSGA